MLVTDRGLCLCSNEAGFSEADVRALCDISKSSKLKGGGKDSKDEQTGRPHAQHSAHPIQ